MASDQKFLDFVLDQLSRVGKIDSKKMFGEYGLYSEEKLFGLICDNKLFIKPTTAGKDFVGKITEASPYPGAKPYFVIEEKIDDWEWLGKLVKITVKELPIPKPKKKK